MITSSEIKTEAISQTNGTEEVKENTSKYPEDTENIRKFREKLLDQIVKVSLNDDRVIYGRMVCLDKLKNLVLLDCIEEVPDKYIAKINYKMQYYVKNPMRVQNYVRVKKELLENPEELKRYNEEFMRNKFYIGQALVPGAAVTKLEVQRFEEKNEKTE